MHSTLLKAPISLGIIAIPVLAGTFVAHYFLARRDRPPGFPSPFRRVSQECRLSLALTIQRMRECIAVGDEHISALPILETDDSAHPIPYLPEGIAGTLILWQLQEIKELLDEHSETVRRDHSYILLAPSTNCHVPASDSYLRQEWRQIESQVDRFTHHIHSLAQTLSK
ncbi:hypothetical protein BJ684DRAFT_20779 [Piptocephalis cylindrospora]|uniref:Uncharacterized protein n=1 Tax=Piptocephalis cylindrospora TaxID=1907219 RepID=A0A4P9Y1K5_9FUNG|nr:hypothetical protein BJ684DRAFT_20779 [Piptocephalis cylindrospora]|eukprot:RKP12698.1 hypothetical protein BJ684DRAFT_20779 [Piptocephalis cylindrospora]